MAQHVGDVLEAQTTRQHGCCRGMAQEMCSTVCGSDIGAFQGPADDLGNCARVCEWSRWRYRLQEDRPV